MSGARRHARDHARGQHSSSHKHSSTPSTAPLIASPTHRLAFSRMARCRSGPSSGVLAAAGAAAGALVLVAMMVPLAHAQGALFTQRLPIQPDEFGYRENFPFSQLLNGGAFQFNQIPLNNVTTPQVIITLRRCGAITPHFHPRGTEQLFVLSGRGEVVLFLEGTTAPDTPIRRIPVEPNVAVILPAGSVHYARNTGLTNLLMVQTFDNPNPGLVTIAGALAAFSNEDVDNAVVNAALPNLELQPEVEPADNLFSVEEGC